MKLRRIVTVRVFMTSSIGTRSVADIGKITEISHSGPVS